MKILEIDKEIKIRSVKKVWEEIEKTSLPVELDFSQFEKFDCAGFQLLIYLMKKSKTNPENYKITGMKEPLRNSLTAYGYRFKEGEHKK